jgi:hypothetical protein
VLFPDCDERRVQTDGGEALPQNDSRMRVLCEIFIGMLTGRLADGADAPAHAAGSAPVRSLRLFGRLVPGRAA